MDRYTKKILELEINYKERIKVLEDLCKRQEETIKILLNQRTQAIQYEDYLEKRIENYFTQDRESSSKNTNITEELFKR